MDQRSRFIILALAVIFSAFRLIRYMRAGTSRRPTAVPPAAGLVLDRVGESAVSPIDPPLRGASRAKVAARALWLGASLALWAALFATPALVRLPVLPRLVFGVLGTLWLVQLARGAAARFGTRPETQPQDQNPIR
jgi:hypothetical protein